MRMVSLPVQGKGRKKMKKMRNIGLLAALAITAGLSALACSWYTAEPPPAMAPRRCYHSMGGV